MKFNIDTKTFKDEVNKAFLACASGAVVIPILKCIVIEAFTSNEVKLIATDLEISIATTMDADVKTPSAVAVDGSLLRNFVNNASRDTIDVVRKKNRLHLKCGSYKASLSVVDVDEFPPVEFIEGDYVEFVNGNNLQKVFLPAYARSNDVSFRVLTGAFLSYDDSSNNICVMAADGFRASLFGTLVKSKGIVIPGNTIEKLKKTIIGNDAVFISIDGGKVCFQYNDFFLQSQLIDQSDRDKVFPSDAVASFVDISNPDQSLRVSKSDLSTALKRVEKYAKGNYVTFEGGPTGVVELRAKNEIGGVSTRINVEGCTTHFLVTFLMKNIGDVVKHLGSEEVEMHFNNKLPVFTDGTYYHTAGLIEGSAIYLEE